MKVKSFFNGLFVLLVGLAFFMAGGTKLAGLEMHVQNFATWGFPPFFMYLIGLVEVTGAIALVFGTIFKESNAQWLSIHGLLLVMGGALSTHWLNGEIDAMPTPAVLAALLIGALLTRKPESPGDDS